jgi:hypothetical protein
MRVVHVAPTLFGPAGIFLEMFTWQARADLCLAAYSELVDTRAR